MKKHFDKKNWMTVTAMIAVVLILTPGLAHAGTGGSELDAIWDMLKDWSQGTLGRIVAISMVLVGLIGGIARQSIFAFAIGVGGGVGLYNTPTVVESIFTATLPAVHTAVDAVSPVVGAGLSAL